MAYKHTYPGLDESNKYFSQVKGQLIHLGKYLKWYKRRRRTISLMTDYGIVKSYFGSLQTMYLNVFKRIKEKEKLKKNE